MCTWGKIKEEVFKCEPKMEFVSLIVLWESAPRLMSITATMERPCLLNARHSCWSLETWEWLNGEGPVRSSVRSDGRYVCICVIGDGKTEYFYSGGNKSFLGDYVGFADERKKVFQAERTAYSKAQWRQAALENLGQLIFCSELSTEFKEGRMRDITL